MGFKENIESDLDVLFNTEEFAEFATIDGVETEIIFKNKDEAVLDNTLHFNIPTAIVRKSFLEEYDIKTGNTLYYKDTNYIITHIEEKDTTLAELYLSKDDRLTF